MKLSAFKKPEIKMPAALANTHQQLTSRYHTLPQRDQRALLMLGAFFVIFVPIAIAFWSNSFYKKSYNKWQNAQDLRVYMQEVGPNLSQDVSNVTAGDLQSMLTSTAGQQGITLAINSTPATNRVEVSAIHPSYNTLASWLNRISDQGGNIEQISLKQEPNKTINLNATITR